MADHDQLSADLASLRIARDENPETRRTWLRWLIVLALLGAIGFGTWQYGVPFVEGKVFKTGVSFTEVSSISPAAAETQLTATGYVMPLTISHLGAKVPGRVARVFVAEGQQVKAGAMVLQLEDADLRSAIAAAEARTLAARARAQTSRATLAETQSQLARNQKLVEKGAAAASVVEDLKLRMESLEQTAKAADADARVAAADVEVADVNLRNLTVRAPLAGKVLNKPPQIGDLVGPATGSVIDIADFATLVVETDVPEQRLHLVKIGGPCEITLDAFPTVRLRGAVSEITPRINRAKATVTVRVKFLDMKDVGVLPDMAARVSFLAKELDEKVAALPAKIVIPASAIAERGGGKVVFVLDPPGGDHVRMQPVTLGPAFGSDGFELVRGPVVGARVVKDPPASLVDGQPVKEKTD